MDGIRGHYERQGQPYYATARLWDDGVIDPLDTRRILGLALHTAVRGPAPDIERYGVFRM
jgi:3-methylcrotonyl-CoA carboxylase beta subunit